MSTLIFHSVYKTKQTTVKDSDEPSLPLEPFLSPLEFFVRPPLLPSFCLSVVQTSLFLFGCSPLFDIQLHAIEFPNRKTSHNDNYTVQ